MKFTFILISFILFSFANCTDDVLYYATKDIFIIDKTLTKINENDITIYYNGSLSSGKFIYDKNQEITINNNDKKNSEDDVFNLAIDEISTKIGGLFNDLFYGKPTNSDDDSSPSNSDEGCDEGFVKENGECVCDEAPCNCGNDYSIAKGKTCYEEGNVACTFELTMLDGGICPCNDATAVEHCDCGSGKELGSDKKCVASSTCTISSSDYADSCGCLNGCQCDTQSFKVPSTIECFSSNTASNCPSKITLLEDGSCPCKENGDNICVNEEGNEFAKNGINIRNSKLSQRLFHKSDTLTSTDEDVKEIYGMYENVNSFKDFEVYVILGEIYGHIKKSSKETYFLIYMIIDIDGNTYTIKELNEDGDETNSPLTKTITVVKIDETKAKVIDGDREIELKLYAEDELSDITNFVADCYENEITSYNIKDDEIIRSDVNPYLSLFAYSKNKNVELKGDLNDNKYKLSLSEIDDDKKKYKIYSNQANTFYASLNDKSFIGVIVCEKVERELSSEIKEVIGYNDFSEILKKYMKTPPNPSDNNNDDDDDDGDGDISTSYSIKTIIEVLLLLLLL